MPDAPARIFPLSCGATLLVEPMADVQSASFSCLVPAGSIYEPAGINGLSAVLTDLVTRGAGPWDSRTFNDRLEELGLQRSEVTGWNFLSFNGSLLAEHLPAALELYAEMLQRARLPQEELAPTIIGVEQSLRALEDEPHRKVFVELRRSAYDDPWGRSSEGTLADLPRITLDRVQELYRSGFTPAPTILGVAGCVEPEAVRDRLESLLAGWRGGPQRQVTAGPRQPPIRHLSHDSAQTHIGLAWEAAPYGHPDYYSAWAAASILGGSSSSRLFTEVRERRGLCYSVSTSLNSVLTEGRVFTYVGTTSERAQETLDVTLDEIAKLSRGIDLPELERCQAHAKSSLVMQQESTAARAAALARDFFFLGRVQTLDEVHDLVQSLTVEGINAYLQAHPADDLVMTTVGREALRIR